MLGVLCGLRRGEIVALRWRNVDLGAGKLAVVESAEQTTAGVRYKPPKSGRGRTVALSATVVDGATRASASSKPRSFFRLGVRQIGRHVRLHTRGWRADAAAKLDPRVGTGARQEQRCRAFASMICGTHTRRICCLAACIRRSRQSDSATRGRASRSILYSHVLPGMQEDAAARVDDALRQALQKRATKGIG